MSKILYPLKIVLLSTQIENLNILNEKNLPNLITFTNFCVLVYIPWWITSPVASQAPINYLHFMQQLFNYAEVDELCATTALYAFSHLFWYLTVEHIPLYLFSKKLHRTNYYTERRDCYKNC